MENEREERPRKKKKKKKSKVGYYLYAIVVLLLGIAIITLSVLLLFHVQKIEIIGTEYSQKSEVSDWIREDPYTSNSIYAFWKIKTGSYKRPAYLEKVDAVPALPWILKIRVTEKKIAGCITGGSEYIFFDKDGLVLLKGNEMMEGMPAVEGVEVKAPKLHEKLQTGNKKVFSYITGLTKALAKHRLSPDRIVWEGDSMNLYFGGVCVRLGKNNFEEKIVQLPPILEKLEGKTGVLKMEYYNETSTSISFREEAAANE